MACQPFVSSNVAFEELVLRSLEASPLIKPFLTPGLKCVRTSRMDSRQMVYIEIDSLNFSRRLLSPSLGRETSSLSRDLARGGGG